MSLRIRAVDVASVKNRQLFFDTNVLLYLFGGTPYPKWAVEAYSRVFGICLTLKTPLCVDVIVLSEFINRFLRIEYKKYLKSHGIDEKQCDFKNFRSTPEGIQAAQDVEMIVNGQILKRFTMVGKLFNESDVSSISLANTDFNDALIVKTCREHQCVLVTNDADFCGVDIDILTANNKLN